MPTLLIMCGADSSIDLNSLDEQSEIVFINRNINIKTGGNLSGRAS